MMSESDNRRVLSLLAHPDDAEFMCAGSLALLQKLGWEVHIATMTPGDCGSATLPRSEISEIRRGEAAAAAALLGACYHCLEQRDVFIFYEESSLRKVITLIRQVQPRMVIAPSPQDYFIDHENTSHLVRTACFACAMPNVETPGIDPCPATPYLYYVDAMEGKDIFGQPVATGFHIDIGSTIGLKERMLKCHASQRDWLMAHHGMDEYIAMMRRHAAYRGKSAGVDYSEVFRQHLGHGHPQDNPLAGELASFVVAEQR